MPRIAYIVTLFPKLSETFVFREVNELRRQGAEVHCFSIHRPSAEPLPADAQHLPAETTYLWPPHVVHFILGVLKFALGSPLRFIKTLRLFMQQAPRNFTGRKRFVLHFLEGVYLAHLCTQRRIDYVHAHFANGPSSVALAASMLSGIPFGFTSHAQDIYADPLMLDLKLEMAQLSLTISACNRDYFLEKFQHLAPEQVKLHRVGVDLNHFQPKENKLRESFVTNATSTATPPFIPPQGGNSCRRSTFYSPLEGGVISEQKTIEPPIILAIGRLVPKKGFIHLIKACEILMQQGLAFRCWIVGGGPEHETLQAAIDAAYLRERVVLWGAQPEVKKYLAQADIFAMPCVVDASGDRDGIPTTLMEAMAMALPVISTDLSGIPELVHHKENGWLLPNGDPEELAQALQQLITNAPYRQQLGENARQYVATQYNLVLNTQRLLQNITTIVARRTQNTRIASSAFPIHEVENTPLAPLQRVI